MTTTIETRRMTVEGIRTSVLVGGNGEPGEAVVFVHGNPDAGSDWMPLMTRVADFATVVAPDLPGFGGADERRDRDYTVYSYARFLDGVIRQLGLRRIHLVAHDFGGPFAAAWAADHPSNVASVTFLNTGVLLGYRWHRMARIWRTPILGELSMRTLDRRLAARELARVNPGLSARWADTIAGHLVPPKTRRAVLRLYRSTRVGDSAQMAARLREHDHDALVVFGDADAYIPVEQARRQVEVFPRAEIHLLPGVGHWCWLEATDDVADLVVPFLRQRIGNGGHPA
ncbi:alpha/beta hydrolase [Mycolicibacterium sp.]|uniref:alpha/beta fold hydrolase n=1 Tax=Mycolicibacterium sp. TaxID=2320850 RepID=UPI0025D9A338|nr:alpha/beta hydrolase [Mycolicibacterium sp.]MCB9409731.1 alpha/beta hydrolase [Mycolicibacterium sp.]